MATKPKQVAEESADVSSAKPKDMANAYLVGKLQGAVRESELREFLAESALMIERGDVSVRGWNESIKEANSSVGFKSSWGTYVPRAVLLLGVEGSERFSVSVLFNTAITASKHVESLKEIKRLNDGSTQSVFSMAKYKHRIEKARKSGESFAELANAWEVEAKATKATRGANKQTGAEGGATLRNPESVDEVVEVAKAVVVTADSVLSMALGLLRELDGEPAVIRDADTLKALENQIRIMSAAGARKVKA
jgi:hypothetical protein